MIQIDVAPDIEQRFTDAARARGLRPEAYASEIIASTVELTEEKHPSAEELEKFLARMTAHSGKMPKLPEEAYSRKSFYQDHD